MYIYDMYRGMCAIIGTCHAYVMWAVRLLPFLYMPAVSNAVTTGY